MKAKIIVVIIILATFLFGWWIGFNDGTITTIAFARPYLTHKEALISTHRADLSQKDVMWLRLTFQMDLGDD